MAARPYDAQSTVKITKAKTKPDGSMPPVALAIPAFDGRTIGWFYAADEQRRIQRSPSGHALSVVEVA